MVARTCCPAPGEVEAARAGLASSYSNMNLMFVLISQSRPPIYTRPSPRIFAVVASHVADCNGGTQTNICITGRREPMIIYWPDCNGGAQYCLQAAVAVAVTTAAVVIVAAAVVLVSHVIVCCWCRRCCGGWCCCRRLRDCHWRCCSWFEVAVVVILPLAVAVWASLLR